MEIQGCNEFIVWEMPFIAQWLSQFGDFLHVGNLLEIECYTACK